MPGRTALTLPAWICVILAGLLLASAAHFTWRQVEEERLVGQFLERHGLAGLPLTRETAVRVSRAVRSEFEVDESRFHTVRIDDRPFLRYDTAVLLRAREGLCGDGARVLVNLLGRLGFDATRVGLHDRRFVIEHVVVSVLLNGEEFFVDTINSPGEVNHLLAEETINAGSFSLVHYDPDLVERRKAIESEDAGVLALRKRQSDFFQRFRAYSYEAPPFTRLMNLVGLDVQVFNFRRPGRLMNTLSEKPNMLLATASLGAACVPLLMLASPRLRRRRAQPS